MTSRKLRAMLALLPLVLGLSLTERSAGAPALPNPVLYLTGAQPHQSGGKQFIRYTYDVFNKDAYPTDFLLPRRICRPAERTPKPRAPGSISMIKAENG